MKKHFRLLSIFLTLAVLLCSLPLPFPANAASIDDLSYTISNGEVTITGCDTSASGELVIPDLIEGYPVTSIGAQAFCDCKNLTKITIPETITKISSEAFLGCEAMTTVNIPGSVVQIEKRAFASCESLISIKIPDGITEIESQAFYGCVNLSNISIPDSVTSIGSMAFYNCRKLVQVNIPSNVTEIRSSAFSDCISLTGITLPDKITTISEKSFSGCTSLTNVVIPEGVTSIGVYAFSDCVNLESVIFSDSVTSIGGSAFAGCTKLSGIVIPTKIASINNSAFSYCTNLADIVIPEGVTQIRYNAFGNCTSLKEITLPCSMQTIDSLAFFECNALETIHYAGTNKEWNEIDIADDALPDHTTITCMKSYTLTYDANGGIGAPPEQYDEPTVTISSQVPTREGYIFIGWATSTDGDVVCRPDNIYTLPENDYTLYAVWARECVITYDANGGMDAPDAQTQLTGVPFQISSQTSTFPGVSNAFNVWCKGWSTERNGNVEYLPGGTYTIEDDITLYAVWHIRCSDCYGFGGHDVDCADCGGTGNGEYCPNCMSNGWLGWETCGFCNGTCRVTVDCPACEGPYGYFWCTCDHGEITEYCGECTNGEVPILCPNCDGDGYFDCDSCSGDGIVFQPNSCVTCTGSGSVLYIPSVLTGDLNDDNSVNEDDAIYLLQHVLLPDIFTVSQNVDYNKDGTVDEDDAIYLLQYVLLPDLFPIS